MKKGTIVIIVIALTIIIVVYMINQRQKLVAQGNLMEQQVALINAQTNQQTACQSSWLCATTSILTGAGDILGGFLGGLGGSNESTNPY